MSHSHHARLHGHAARRQAYRQSQRKAYGRERIRAYEIEDRAKVSRSRETRVAEREIAAQLDAADVPREVEAMPSSLCLCGDEGCTGRASDEEIAASLARLRADIDGIGKRTAADYDPELLALAQAVVESMR